MSVATTIINDSLRIARVVRVLQGEIEARCGITPKAARAEHHPLSPVNVEPKRHVEVGHTYVMSPPSISAAAV
jgi:hypothetical protein